ncbi:uncharacterized protein N7483_010473 [Penicillium malachiteum]|uniref:uncharacterized protein n=1 Tax=Penicillium malachiteum TaxID=1324776 RepID=UPI0025480871|nr:uncharacterized protein N7483_010473 [Penicillium malachiteum]KAJ5713292.1 hypothetical protein N7483_010473 [Penicillium malachiteum]
MTPKGSRKRVKPSPSGVDSPFPASPSNAAPAQSQERLSWYPGSWSAISRGSKAAPVTEVARESISVAQNVACSVADSSNSSLHSPKRNRAQSIQLIKKAGASTRSLPADVATTRVNIASDGSASTTAQANSEPNPSDEPPADKVTPVELATKNPEKSAEEQGPTVDGDPDPNALQPEDTSAAEQPSGWFSWLYKPGNIEKSTVQSAELEASTDRPTDTPENSNKAAELETNKPQSTEQYQQLEQNQDPEDHAQGPSTTEITSTAQKRSWLQMWYGSSSNKPEEQPASEPAPPSTEAEPSATADVEMTSNDPPEGVTEGHGEESRPPQAPVGSVKSSGWSFWAKDTSKDGMPAKPQEVEVVEGSMATNSASRPQELEPDMEANVKITPKGSIRVKPDSRVKDGAVSIVEAISTSTPPAEPRPADVTASKQLQKVLSNQVLPRFEETYSLEESPSLFQSLGRFLHYTKGPEHNHVSRVKEPPRIKRALAIGVHGYFPAPLIRSVLGQPTGTSIRFSNMAAESIRKYTADHGYSCEIEKIALEGEGRISERVDLLWKLLLNWMEEIRKADFILVACHSQGVPVSIMLVAKLISFGCVNASRVGVCAMAGVNMGPFSSYRSRWISGSAGELFEFEQPSSRVSKDYGAALRCALDFGVRISYIGSIDDQLVSLESSLFSPINHPYIYRSVFVDGRVHAPSFVSHLVGFALKLRNLGIPDHGLIRELSTPLAGSLYTGDGHSRLYDDEAVYYMAIQFALETSIVPEASLEIKRSSPSVPSNPFILPFAMRGLLEEEHVRREMNEETMELLRQFDDWKPSSKVLKDVKFRLEGIRSKL